jgi:catechol-2,3-dioxygenase
MEAFYTRALGFTVTDRGDASAQGMRMVFLSRSPNDHHQIVLASGRSDEPNAGSRIQHISFQMTSLDDLRGILQRLETEGASRIFPANHGIAWSIYAQDPEGNPLEFFIDTEWYIKQPFLVPLDLTKTNDEIARDTQAMCEGREAYELYDAWRSRMAAKMTQFVER